MESRHTTPEDPQTNSDSESSTISSAQSPAPEPYSPPPPRFYSPSSPVPPPQDPAPRPPRSPSPRITPFFSECDRRHRRLFALWPSSCNLPRTPDRALCPDKSSPPPTPQRGLKMREKPNKPTTDPKMRQSGWMQWPLGVMNCGRILDIMETLSRTQNPVDVNAVQWLQEHYIEPFGQFGRRDGLVVSHEKDVKPLLFAYRRFIQIEGRAALMQRLWVPGLEPVQECPRNGDLYLPKAQYEGLSEPWYAAEFSTKYGADMETRGKCEGEWRDEVGWQRTIWSALVRR